MSEDFTRDWLDEGYNANQRGQPCKPPENYVGNAAAYWVSGWKYANMLRGLSALPDRPPPTE